MLECHVRLGTGIAKDPSQALYSSIHEDFPWKSIEEMGIKDIRQLCPSQNDLFEIYSELKTFGFSTKYQDLLEEKLTGSKVRTGLRFPN